MITGYYNKCTLIRNSLGPWHCKFKLRWTSQTCLIGTYFLSFIHPDWKLWLCVKCWNSARGTTNAHSITAVTLSERLMTHHRLCDTSRRIGALQLRGAGSNTLTRWEFHCCTRDTQTGILQTHRQTKRRSPWLEAVCSQCGTAAPRTEQKKEEETRKHSNSQGENGCIMKWQEWRTEWMLGGMLVFKTRWLESRVLQAGIFPAQTQQAGAELWL